MEQRKYIRHPSDVPISADYDLSGIVADDKEYLKDISVGGLAFQSNRALDKGATIRITIPLVDPAFEIVARVVWCTRANGQYDVGVEFLEPEKIFKARMVEQVCHIEHYKREVSEQEGRTLTSEEAALEWIEKRAADFPKL